MSNQNDSKIDLLFKAISLLALPAFAWVLSLSSERARMQEKITFFESRLSAVEKALKENEKSVNELVTTAKFILEDVKELKASNP